MSTDIAQAAGTEVGKHTRQSIQRLEHAIKELPGALDEQEALEKLNEHMFAPGVYCRFMTLPKGMVVVGKIHKHAHICIVTQGVVKIVTEFGEGVHSAPYRWISEPGVKRTLVALTDFQMVNIMPNPTDTQDLDEIDKHFSSGANQGYGFHKGS